MLPITFIPDQTYNFSFSPMFIKPNRKRNYLKKKIKGIKSRKVRERRRKREILKREKVRAKEIEKGREI
jgi:hypothetical protein